MGSNKEIRQRMDTYRGFLLFINWVGPTLGIIGGLILLNFKASFKASGEWYFLYDVIGLIRIIGLVVIVISILAGIIGHFLINVSLTIPFILLNNGDILESMKRNAAVIPGSTSSNTNDNTVVRNKFQKKCKTCQKEVDEDYTSCPHCGNKTFE
jgi:hypothetical protein